MREIGWIDKRTIEIPDWRKYSIIRPNKNSERDLRPEWSSLKRSWNSGWSNHDPQEQKSTTREISWRERSNVWWVKTYSWEGWTQVLHNQTAIWYSFTWILSCTESNDHLTWKTWQRDFGMRRGISGKQEGREWTPIVETAFRSLQNLIWRTPRQTHSRGRAFDLRNRWC